LYADDPIGVELDQGLYALDSTTIDLCLSIFPWAKFRRHKAAVKMHTLLDLHGNIPTFIRITDGKVHDVNILDEILPEAGAFYVMDRGYIATSISNVSSFSNFLPPSLSYAPKTMFCCNGALFEKEPILQVLQSPDDEPNTMPNVNQLILFDI